MYRNLIFWTKPYVILISIWPFYLKHTDEEAGISLTLMLPLIFGTSAEQAATMNIDEWFRKGKRVIVQDILSAKKIPVKLQFVKIEINNASMTVNTETVILNVINSLWSNNAIWRPISRPISVCCMLAKNIIIWHSDDLLRIEALGADFNKTWIKI